MSRWTTASEMLARGFGTHAADAVDVGTIRENAVREILAPMARFPEQRVAFQAFLRAKQMALCCPRRAGKTDGAWRTVLARMVARDSYVVRVLAEDLSMPTVNFLDSDDKPSLVKEIERLGLMQFCQIRGRASGKITLVRFDWGSSLHVKQIRFKKAVAKNRGTSAHLFWFDEAQDLTHLASTMATVVRPMLADHGGQVLLTGTPGFAVGSYFYQAVFGSAWESSSFMPWDNPFFGPDDASRWHRLLEDAILTGIDDYGLTADDVARLRSLTRDERMAIASDTIEDPDLAAWVDQLDTSLVKEFFSRWARGGSQYVYNWHKPGIYWGHVDDHFAAPSCSFPHLPTFAQDDDFDGLDNLIAERVAALPVHATPWRAVISADPGTPNGPSGSAAVVVVYNQAEPAARVLFSHVDEVADTADLLATCAALAAALSRAGVEIECLVGDFAGVGVKDRRWHDALAVHFVAPIAIELAIKTGKYQQIHALNLALRRSVLKVLSGDRLDAEGLNLQWKPFDDGKPQIDKWRPVTLPTGHTLQIADHALDALRYSLPFLPISSALPLSVKTLAQERAEERRQVKARDRFLRRHGNTTPNRIHR